MATVNFIASHRMQTRSGLAFILSYCKREAKTFHDGRQLVTGINCLARSVYHEFMNTKLANGKAEGRMFYHLVQSFSPEEKLTPETAHEIALKFAEQFSGYEVLVATHVDRHHIHSHFVVNSVSAETGKKYHSDKDEIQRLRATSDELCRAYGLSVVKPKPRTVKPMSEKEYRVAERGESRKLRLAIQIDDAMKHAGSREAFIFIMENEGYQVMWSPSRKSITYTTPEGLKCRDTKLHEAKYLKENMEHEFRIRKKITRGTESEDEAADVGGQPNDQHGQPDGGELARPDRCAANAERGAGAGAGAPLDAGDEGGDGLGPEPTGGMPGNVHGAEPGSDREISDDDGDIGGEYECATESDAGSDEPTGWEPEREIFLCVLDGGGAEESVGEEAVLDQSDSLSGLATIGIGAAVASAGLIFSDDRRPIQDSTTMKHPRKERKDDQKYGPVMGGM